MLTLVTDGLTDVQSIPKLYMHSRIEQSEDLINRRVERESSMIDALSAFIHIGLPLGAKDELLVEMALTPRHGS